MKVQFLKQHLSYKKDGVYDVDNGLGQYLISVKAAKEVKGEDPEAEKEKVEVKQVKEKNEKAAPVKKKKK